MTHLGRVTMSTNSEPATFQNGAAHLIYLPGT